MSPMSRGLVHALAWSLSTGAAVTLSWWGVHTVMAGTAYDRPRALPITAQTATASPAPPQQSSTHRPPPGPSASPSPKPSPSAPDRGSPSPSRTPAPPPSPTPPAPSPAPGNVKGYTVDGGRVVFDIGASSAELVSATPESGWQMQVWKQPSWIRVTFTQEGREVSVFCTWNDHPPMVQFDER
ncbi:hypothetical protein [Streptomyces zhihengii]|uniref:Secreted protein n=1 Tax=Streptomyces zhihengii TaxID=1818004 RepID=A0ABS2UVF0_9ACTN|nr:hypothetical protein [Streptomyces zhihengii]MBM9621430.1 hypothetical protein [Streptomyces zhihengii]